MIDDIGFKALVTFMYDNVVPQSGYTFVDEEEDMRAFYARTGMIPVIEDVTETEAFHKMQAWIKYREFGAAGSTLGRHGSSQFDLLVNDVMRFNKEHKGCDVGKCITVLDAIVNVTQEYETKFKHQPVCLDKFVTSYVKHGRASVLRADIY